MAERTITIALGGREWKIHRARLGGFLKLQQARDLINQAVKDADNGRIVGGIFDFLRIAIPDLELAIFHSEPWYEVFHAYTQVESLNKLPDEYNFAIISFTSESKSRIVPWDNPLRTIIIWIHLIAKTYGWSRAEIEEMWPEEAIAFVQEIMADEHHEHAFSHSLSQMAYEYNKTTKKSHYRPMAKPAWMIGQDAETLITALKGDWIPVGEVVYPKDVDETLVPKRNDD